MKRSNLWRSVSALLMAGCICCTMPSCSDDDGPAVIEAAQPTASDYELNEAGEVALEFEVVPGDAQVDEVTIVGGNSAFESKGFTPKGNGKWVLNAKVIDFTQIKQDNAITLSIAQTGGTPSNVLFSVYDPFAIENKFQLKMSFISKWLYIFALKNRNKCNLPLFLHLNSALFCSVSQSRVPTLMQR